jgi:hypothetical protein
MTHIVELRKDPRPATTAEPQPPRTRSLPGAHIPSYIQKILGLEPTETGPAEALTAE